MIVSFNFYYAKPGLEDAVLQQRLRACEVRERLAIPRGRVLSRTCGTGELPDVIWEQKFESVAKHLADMDVRAASPDFESIRTGMRKLYRRFERPLFEIYADAAAVNFRVPSCGTVMLDWIFCDAEKTEPIVELLQQTAAHGEAPPRVNTRLLRLITPGNDLPELVWQREYADTEQMEAAQAALVGKSGQTRGAMAALARRVEHSLWSVA